jgi:hypothetical protein
MSPRRGGLLLLLGWWGSHQGLRPDYSRDQTTPTLRLGLFTL